MSLLPDRGHPTLTGWWVPVAQHIYIEEWGTGLSSRGSKEPPHPPTENSNPIKGCATSDGICLATAVVPLQVYTGPPSRHRAGAAPTLASTLLLCRNSERREGSSPDLRVSHREVHTFDPNNVVSFYSLLSAHRSSLLFSFVVARSFCPSYGY